MRKCQCKVTYTQGPTFQFSVNLFKSNKLFKNDYIPDRGIENELNLIRLDKFTGDLSSFWQIRTNQTS